MPLLSQNDDKVALKWACKETGTYDSPCTYLVDLPHAPQGHVLYAIQAGIVMSEKPLTAQSS